MKLGIVLSGGGSRAAYQVGVLKYIVENFPNEFRPTVWCGTSAGAINTAFMAQFADDPERGVRNLSEVWGNLHCGDVYQVGLKHLITIITRWVYNLFLGKFVDSARYRSLVDTDPLYRLLQRTIDPERIHKCVREGLIDAVSVTTTEYGTGKAVIFIESHDANVEWQRAQRVSRRTLLSVDHVMASCAIPFLFPATSISGIYYGDGSMRDKAPFSPPAKLGVDKILAIGVRAKDSDMGDPARRYPSVAAIGGTIMNSIFLDSLDSDYENMERVNRLVRLTPQRGYRPLEALLLRPSRDLGALAMNYVNEIPLVVRQAVHGFGKAKRSSSDFLSYITFSGGYARTLMTLGYNDCKLNHEALAQFFKGSSSAASTA